MTGISKIRCCGFYIKPTELDLEYRRILQRLNEYGMTATGDKQIDKLRLKERELEEVQKGNCVNTEFVVVKPEEQREILREKKEEKFEEKTKQLELDKRGQEALGEQIYLAILMKDKDDSRIEKFLEEQKKKMEL